jgi:hypothetical protein
VALFLENHVEGIAFQPYDPAAGVEAHLDPREPAPAESHFFVAICGHHTIPAAPLCLYVPRAGNVLRERGRHIALLEEQLVRALAAYRRQTEELERSNQWAQKLNQEIEERRARVVALQDELAQQQQGYQAKVKELEEDIQAKVQWAQHRGQELALAVEALHRTEKELEDRTTWARSLEEEKRHSQEQLRASRWMRIGRKFGLGPELPG